MDEQTTELLRTQVGRFFRARWWLVVLVSAMLLVPCFWHRRIEAGDLPSHVYNAWLAQLVEKGEAPGLYTVHQWNNVLYDVALLEVGKVAGLAAAEKIVVSASVLIFFWGAFALLSAASGRSPWHLVPCVAMLSYGYTFNMGFFNFYVSLGLAFFSLAILWRGRGVEQLAGLVLAPVVLLAHPIGLLWLAGAVAYVRLSERIPGWHRFVLPVAAVVGLEFVHWYLPRHYEVNWREAPFYWFNGADQLGLFGMRYAVLARFAFFFGVACFAWDVVQRKKDARWWRERRLLFEMYFIAVCATALLPENMHMPFYAGWIGLLVSRLTTITAVLGLCVMACLQPRKWHLAGFAACAAVFFSFLYQDTAMLNRMEEQAEGIVSGLPYGRRVTPMLWAPEGWRVAYIGHLVDRACIGHCFSYSNYEPSSGQFRIRVRPGSPVVTDSSDAAEDMEGGEYVVQKKDLPLTQIYQCDETLTRLCARELKAGEKTGLMDEDAPE
jgi:hypothetical protein